MHVGDAAQSHNELSPTEAVVPRAICHHNIECRVEVIQGHEHEHGRLDASVQYAAVSMFRAF
jgi:hypothetical protein